MASATKPALATLSDLLSWQEEAGFLCWGAEGPWVQCWPVDGSGWPSQDRPGEGDSFQMQEFLWREGNRRGVRI